ncbi:MAG TPA: nucleoid occlusion protein [Firmicutes bacterium]|jgi:ParB family chromosome partitioning protein|nr:nucleoid occlusion protein [Bacillota bacterium]
MSIRAVIVVKEQLVRLFGLAGGANTPANAVQELPLNAIKPNPYQPRRQFSEEELSELADSIRQYGVLQPVVVRPGPRGLELVAGERRLRACKMLGLQTIPAVVKELSDQDLAVLALVENLQREDLNFFEEAQGYQRLLEEFGLTQEELAKRIGKSQSTIANKIRLLKLSPRVQAVISREIITERHARALLKLPGEEQQLSTLEKIVEKDLTVQETEDYIARILQGMEKGEHPQRRKVVRIYKDMRIFFNTIQQAVQELQRVGFAARVEKVEKDEYYEVTVLIPKKPAQE